MQSRRPGASAISLDAAVAQAKLTVGPVADPYEREADDVADRVVESLEGGQSCEAGSQLDTAPELAQRVQRIATIDARGGNVDSDTEAAISNARGGGQALPADARSQMEGAFGADFRGVRVHEGPQATELNERIQAKAFTVGSDVFFRDGIPDTSTASGQHLLAHELTHTIQQGGAVARRATDGDAPASDISHDGGQQVRRMPGPATIERRAGKKSKKGAKLFGKQVGATNTYNAMLDAVRAHTDHVMKTAIGANASQISGEIATMSRYLDNIIATAKAYKSKEELKSDKKRDVRALGQANDLIAMANAEKRILPDIGAYWANRGTTAMGRQKWGMEIPRDPRTYKPKMADMQPTNVTAKVGASGGKGNNKAVSQVVNEKGESGFFADDDFDGKYEAEADGTDQYDNPKWLLNNYGAAGNQDIQLGNRSIAMSRLDKLLGGDVMARTVRAFNGDKQGTFQAKADGKEAKEVLESTDVSGNPDLARMLSRLQLLDAIAGQVDRHAKNYFIQIDPRSKRVTGITGIDLDMSWMGEDGRFEVDVEMGSRMGSQKNNADGGKTDHFPGFSKFVDKELAERIIAMKPNDLRAILLDLLDPKLIESAVRRLAKLQNLLQRETTNLLEPKDWDHAIPSILTEKRSYFSRDGGASAT